MKVADRDDRASSHRRGARARAAWAYLSRDAPPTSSVSAFRQAIRPAVEAGRSDSHARHQAARSPTWYQRSGVKVSIPAMIARTLQPDEAPVPAAVERGDCDLGGPRSE